MSEFLRHEPCPNCGSRDNLARYTDNHAWCFGCNYYEKGDGEHVERKETRKVSGLIDYEILELGPRKLTEETCRKWNYGVGNYNGQPVQVANYHDSHGELVAQKLRFKDKSFRWLGDYSRASLYGRNLWRDNDKMVTIVEGEIDALSVSQAFGLKWPVLSLSSGISHAHKEIAKNLNWLESYESVVLFFDQDDRGREMAKTVAQLFTPGKAKIVGSLSEKDANDCLKNGKVKEIVDAVYSAKSFRPDGVVPGTELWDVIVKEDTREKIPYPWDGLNDKLFGMRGGELVTLTGGTGIGKSSITRELAYYFLNQGKTVGYVALEESMRVTADNILGLYLNCPPFYWERDGITVEQKRQAYEKTVGSGKMYLYDHWGSLDPSNLLTHIRYMIRAMECDVIVLDHLSIVVSSIAEGDERRMIDSTMTKLRSLVEETGVHLILVSHLKRPDGRPHEEGGQTSLAQLRGSTAIACLSDAVIGCERDQQDEHHANRMRLRVLKNRYSGSTGPACYLEYDGNTGRLREWEEIDVVAVPSGGES